MANIRPNQLPPATTITNNDRLIIDQGAAGVNAAPPKSLLDTFAPIATQSEAEAGTDNVKRMTPLRAQQHLLAQGVPNTRSIIAGDGLAGGGTLDANLELALSSTSLTSLALADSAVQSVNGKTGSSVTLTKSDVGLGNVDNTSDAAKPISTATQTALNAKANSSVTITAGVGLTGGGNLTANRTIALNSDSIASLGKADTALQAPGGVSGQVLVKQSAADNDVSWENVDAATAVSYGPQTLTAAQQVQARQNIQADHAYDTIADITSATVPAYANAIRTNGYAAPGDGGAALYKRVASEPAHAGKVMSADGAWWEIVGDTIPVEALGVSSGATDNTSALAAAITFASSRKAELFFRPGSVYNVAARQPLGSNVRLRGNGATILATTSFNTGTGAQFFYAGNASDIKISQLNFDGTAAHVGGVWFQNCSRVIVEDCEVVADAPVQPQQRYGVHFQNCIDASVSRCHLHHVYYGVFVSGGGKNIHIKNNIIHDLGRFGISVLDNNLYASGLRIQGNRINGVGSRASLIYIGATANSELTGRYEDVIVSDNYCEGADASFLGGSGNGDLLSLRGMRNARVYGNYARNGGDLGLVVEYSEDVTVSSNIVERADISGIVIHRGTRVSVTGNIARDNCLDRDGLSNVSAIRGGIRIMDGSGHVVVSGNVCVDTRSQASKTQLWGLVLQNAGENVRSVFIGENDFSENKIGGVFVQPGARLPDISFNLSVGSALPALMHCTGTRVVFRNVQTGSPFMSVADYFGAITSSSASASGSTTLTVSDASSITPGLSRLAINLANGTIQFVGVTSKTGNNLTIDNPLAYIVDAGSVVFHTRWRDVVVY